MTTEAQKPNKILQITACMTRGESRDFANVYGLDDSGRVWQWDPKAGRWRPFVIVERGRDSSF